MICVQRKGLFLEHNKSVLVFKLISVFVFVVTEHHTTLGKKTQYSAASRENFLAHLKRLAGIYRELDVEEREVAQRRLTPIFLFFFFSVCLY